MKTTRAVGAGVAFVLAITFILHGQVALAAIPVETISESATNVRKLPDPGGDDNGGANLNIFNRSSYVPPDYGTNLWIANFVSSPSNAVGTLSNSLADVLYEIQFKHSLTTDTQWLSGGFVYGSELTNWTALVMTNVSRTNNAFFRIRSWEDDGNGLPIWWQLQYFGHAGLDSFSFDPSGDGFTLQGAFMAGLNPTVFNLPPGPQGLTVNYNPASNTANVSWQPSFGSVTGYTVTRNDNGNLTSFYFSAATSHFTDTTQPQVPNLNDFVAGPISYNPTYQVQAQYTGGHSSAWSAPMKLLNAPGAVSVNVVYDSQETAYLAMFGLPQNTAILHVTRIGPWDADGDPLSDTTATNFDISVASLNNGACALSQSQAVPPDDGAFYTWWVQTTGTNTSPSDATGFGFSFAQTPFYDGRVQLKQNLMFLLRAGLVDSAFHYVYGLSHNYPTNYVYAALYGPSGQFWDTGDPIIDMEVLRPFEDNYLFRNFVFSLADVNTSGKITTGVGSSNPGGISSLTLQNPPAYQFHPPVTNWTTTAAVMPTNATRWLCSYPIESWVNSLFEIGATNHAGINGMFSNVRNIYGLAFLSAEIAWGNTGGTTTTLLAGNTTAANGYFYPETVQPLFQTVEYDFWGSGFDWFPPLTRLPGMPGFSTTNKTSLFITTVANAIQVEGYAKLAVMNGYSGVYAYLGQYFDKAYTEDANGVATTNSAGFLEHYGTFWPTVPGPAALVTMPDVDTGARGTCTVYCVSLVLDKNHDGTMDLSFNGADATSQASPAQIWVNNDYDWASQPGYPVFDPGSDKTIGANYADTFMKDYLSLTPNSIRDLEDWSRLWICGVPVLTNGNYQVTLGWANASGTPAINLIWSCETNGGMLYLTDTNVFSLSGTAWRQISSDYGYKYRVPTTGTLTLPGNWFTNAINKYFLFEGAGIGSGELVMTISQNSTTVAQAGVWLDLHDVKDFYERAVITNNISGAVSNWTSGVEIVQPAVTSALGDDTNLIVLVHGFNVGSDDWLIESDTVFKRLYWAGYHGKFMTVKWPCEPLTLWNAISENTSIFNNSEINSYKAGTALKNYLSQLRTRFPNYRLNVLAHSQGNAIMGEAIEQGAPFDTYILTQGAMPASSYDVNASTNSTLLAAEFVYGTPEWKPMGYHGVYTNFTGRIFNFYNSFDPVLAVWIADQAAGKPDGYAKHLLSPLVSYYNYDGVNGWHNGMFFGVFSSYLVTDPQESRAMLSRSLTDPIGRSGLASAHGVIQSAVDLNSQFGFYNSFPGDHSAEWVWPIQTSLPYYNQILIQIKPLQ